jgi:hypothetical protein
MKALLASKRDSVTINHACFLLERERDFVAVVECDSLALACTCHQSASHNGRTNLFIIDKGAIGAEH